LDGEVTDVGIMPVLLFVARFADLEVVLFVCAGVAFDFHFAAAPAIGAKPDQAEIRVLIIILGGIHQKFV
jgi:hypothetical protein